MKIKKTGKILSIALSFGLMFTCGIAGIASLTKETVKAEEVTAVKASDLFSTANPEFVDNKKIPDYMIYDKYYDAETKRFVTATKDSKDLGLEENEMYGLGVNLTASEVKYNNVVDISQFSQQTPLFKIAITPVTPGSGETTQLAITLRDAEQPDTHNLTIIYEDRTTSLGYNNFWIRIHTDETLLASPTSYQRSRHIYHGINLDGTTWDTTSHTGVLGDKVRHTYLAWAYDYEQDYLYLRNHYGSYTNFGRVSEINPNFKGFPSGKVTFSVRATALQAASANAIILNAFGQDMMGETIKDTTAPSLKFEEHAKVLPNAVVGLNYPVFQCESNDVVDGKITPVITVKDESGSTVRVRQGKFIPTSAGKYTIHYQATDKAGNKAEKSFTITAQESVPKINIVTDASQESKLFNVGTTITVPQMSSSGGLGRLTNVTKVERLGGEEILLAEDNTFVPIYAGKYVITYTATDYIGNQETKTMIYTVQNNGKAVFSTIQKLKRLVHNYPVKVPVPTVNDYSDPSMGLKKGIVEIKAYSADGTYSETIPANGIFTPDYTKFGNSVKFVYTIYCQGKEAQAHELFYTVELFEKLSVTQDLFVYDEEQFDTVVNANGEGGIITFKSKEGIITNMPITYFNPISDNNLVAKLNVPVGYQSFDKIVCELRDSENADIGFNYTISRNGLDALYLNIEGNSYSMTTSFNKLNDAGKEVSPSYPIAVTYRDGVLSFNDKALYTPTKNFDGTTFKGFTSGKAYMTYYFEGITGATGISFIDVGSTGMTTSYKNGEPYFKDIIAPKFTIDELDYIYSIGDIVNIPVVDVYDDVTNYLEVTLTIRTPSGIYLYKEAPLTEGIQVKIEEYGNYTLLYETYDAGGKKGRLQRNFSAVDTTEPTIILESYAVIECQKGATVLIPKCVLQDDKDKAPRLFLFLIHPGMVAEELGEVTEETPITSFIAPNKSGTYLLRYMVLDSNNNVTIQNVKVIVK